jgi:prepilin-type N-terminal cleavage/methylation domain-containing protein
MYLRKKFTKFLPTKSVMKNNDRGFTLVEIMIAAAMVGGLSLVLLQMNKVTVKSTAKSQFDTDVLLTTNEINGILSDPIKCLATLQTTATPTNITNGKYYISSNALAPAQGYGNSGLMIISYTLSVGATANDGVLTIVYQNKNILKDTSGPASIIKKINLFITGTPGAITTCRSLSSSSTDIWSRGTVSNIYYSGGDVGIGTSTPVTQLDVAGGIKPGDQTQVTICDTSTEGTQRYNKLTHAMEYCGYNSGPPVTYSWMAMGGAGINSCIIANSGVVWNTATATCPVGYKMTGGGCDSVPQTGHFRSHYPNSSNSFFCWDFTSQNIIAYAICCK